MERQTQTVNHEHFDVDAEAEEDVRGQNQTKQQQQKLHDSIKQRTEEDAKEERGNTNQEYDGMSMWTTLSLPMK